eukprot:TRINITY_DN1975_c1_g1_i1.p1 TRINITY_DN1975_c1_g1~~TRINITY_DN1975_c1_g1_i1.p1  ORF type:complete len:261 (+),score=36.09 TRINITY_DN1975_c1_g1_i1:40-822(+)
MSDLYHFPWRICLAGGWLDQPWCSKLCPGPVIVVNIHPHPMFKTRSGLATSTRKVGIALWGTDHGGKPPAKKASELARFLFNCENPVDCKYVSGSQDALGLMLPGISRLDYNGKYWPAETTTISDPETVAWLEEVLWLIPLPSRPDGYNPLKEQHLTEENAKKIADASTLAWEGILKKDSKLLGKGLTGTMSGWSALLPETVPSYSREWYQPFTGSEYDGCLFSGAGGGFLLVVSSTETALLKEKGFKISIKTTPWMSKL